MSQKHSALQPPRAVESLGSFLDGSAASVVLGLARVVIVDTPASAAGPCCAVSMKTLHARGALLTLSYIVLLLYFICNVVKGTSPVLSSRAFELGSQLVTLFWET